MEKLGLAIGILELFLGWGWGLRGDFCLDENLICVENSHNNLNH